MTGVLFVCLGNICRSPLAKASFVDLARRRGVSHLLDIDSCGTGHWHVGSGADRRAIETASRNGVELVHTARQLAPLRDFARFEFLVAMDRSNRADLVSSGAPQERVHLMRDFDPACAGQGLDVPDPYYGPADGFESVYRMLSAACAGLLERVVEGASEREL